MSWSRVVEETPEERAWLDEYTSCPQTTYRGGKRHEGTFRMVHPQTSVMPTGLLPLVQQAAAADGIQLTVEDTRPPPPARVDQQADLRWLRDYQVDAVMRAARAGRGLIKAPTGAGKSEIFIGLTRVLDCEWLFVVHRTDLVRQAANRYHQRTGETAGTFEKGRWQRGSCNVTVATFQSLVAHMKKRNPGVQELIDAVQALMVDEVHAQPADSFYKVTLKLVNARFRYGLSGTPLDRGPVAALRTIGALGPIVYKISTELLTARGYLAKPTIRMRRCEQYSAAGATWQEVYRDLVVRSPERNEVVCRMVDKATKPALVFVEHVDHGRRLQELLQKRGHRVEFVYGSSSLDGRQRKIRHLVEGRQDVLICNVIFQEGIDIPELQSVVVAAGKSSAVAALQRLGRGMRTSEGKDTFELWDVFDRGQDWLARHATARKQAYRKGGHEVVISQDLKESFTSQGKLDFAAHD